MNKQPGTLPLIEGTHGEYSVYQFMNDEINEKLRQFVSLDEAMDVAFFYTNNVAAKVGITKRVIVTDGGDYCVFEWKFGEGITWPKKEGVEG